MPALLKVGFHGACVALCLVACGDARAQEIEAETTVEAEPAESGYYQPPLYQPNARAIIHHKAQTRSFQRQARLASMSWYGMSNGRPTAGPTPFTSLYSPVWQAPGGRPFAWYPGWRTSYAPYYR
jgi:hypothetical protein